MVQGQTWKSDAAEAGLVVGAHLDDVLVGIPAAAAPRVPELATAAFSPVGCEVGGAKTKVWVPSGVCPDGCTEWWSPRGLRVPGAPEEAETPLAALGEPGLVAEFLGQALRGYAAFTE